MSAAAGDSLRLEGSWGVPEVPALADLPAGPPAPRRPDLGAGIGALLQSMLDELDYGLMLVGERGLVLLANRAARHQCSPAHPLRVHHGCLRPRDERQREALLNALAAARGGRRSLLQLLSQEHAVSLAVVPLAAPAAAGEAPILLVFGKQHACAPLTIALFGREHRLTASERNVLEALSRGLRPAQIARALGVADSAVRTHIGKIREKMQARGIGDLLRRLTVLPPLLPRLTQPDEHDARWHLGTA